jgi:hypothetical protein
MLMSARSCRVAKPVIRSADDGETAQKVIDHPATGLLTLPVIDGEFLSNGDTLSFVRHSDDDRTTRDGRRVH